MATASFRTRAQESSDAVDAALGKFGRKFFVDAKVGNASNNGQTPSSPFLTMAAAFAQLQSGDTIFMRGKVREQLSTPAGVFDVTIIGAGNRPRHADDHTESAGLRGSSGATWAAPASPTASTPLLKVLQQGWKVQNILFGAAPAGTPSIQLFRDGGAGSLERDASHFHMLNCRVDGSPVGIQDSGGCAFVRIEDSLFRGMTTAALNAVSGAGIGTLLCWQIIGNMFQDNVSHIILGLNQGIIKKNVMGKFTTSSIVLTGGTGDNVITENSLSGTFSVGGGYTKAAASDEWGGNWNSLSGGVTASDPA